MVSWPKNDLQSLPRYPPRFPNPAMPSISTLPTTRRTCGQLQMASYRCLALNGQPPDVGGKNLWSGVVSSFPMSGTTPIQETQCTASFSSTAFRGALWQVKLVISTSCRYWAGRWKHRQQRSSNIHQTKHHLALDPHEPSTTTNNRYIKPSANQPSIAHVPHALQACGNWPLAIAFWHRHSRSWRP